jgi:hypothetical protein
MYWNKKTSEYHIFHQNVCGICDFFENDLGIWRIFTKFPEFNQHLIQKKSPKFR